MVKATKKNSSTKSTAKTPGKKLTKKQAETRLSTKATYRAKTVLDQARDCTNGLLNTLTNVRTGARGALTDEQQDLLRATLVFAAAGLDSALKELMKHSIPHLALFDPEVRDQLVEYAARKFRDEQAAHLNGLLANNHFNPIRRLFQFSQTLLSTITRQGYVV